MQKTFMIPLIAALASCDSNNGSGNRIEESFYYNQIRWQSADVQSYTYEYSGRGFSPLAGSRWLVRVEEGAVAEVSYIGTDTPSITLSTDAAPTVDDLYTGISACFVSADCEVVELEYHEDAFVPASYYAETGSEGWGFEVHDFNAL